MRYVVMVLDILVFVLTFGAWLSMFRSDKNRLLSENGFQSLKFFTTLSNLFAGVVGLVLFVVALAGGVENAEPLWGRILRYTAAHAVSVTFLVVIFFLGRKFGYKPMFQGSLFVLHGAGPVLAILAFLLSGGSGRPGVYVTFIGILPLLFYGIFYVWGILHYGLGEGEKTRDWYHFTDGGRRKLLPVFLGMMLMGWVLALILWFAGFR